MTILLVAAEPGGSLPESSRKNVSWNGGRGTVSVGTPRVVEQEISRIRASCDDVSSSLERVQKMSRHAGTFASRGGESGR
jgi:hypothetical protein